MASQSKASSWGYIGKALRRLGPGELRIGQCTKATIPRGHQSDREFWLHVGHRYRVARLALGLTEEEAAAAAGVTVKTWHKWENAGPRRTRRLGPLDFAVKFDVSIGWLFCGQGSDVGRHLAEDADGPIAILPRGTGYPLPGERRHKRGRLNGRSNKRKASERTNV
jgi:transcriptional regulator with XRE-family HTH domain